MPVPVRIRVEGSGVRISFILALDSASEKEG